MRSKRRKIMSKILPPLKRLFLLFMCYSSKLFYLRRLQEPYFCSGVNDLEGAPDGAADRACRNSCCRTIV